MTSSARDIGALTDFVTGDPQRVELDGRALVVVRNGDDVYALRDICSHQGARLSNGRVTGITRATAADRQGTYERAGEFLMCPWHGWTYELSTGRAIVDPVRARVRSYPVSVRNGRVIVDLG